MTAQCIVVNVQQDQQGGGISVMILTIHNSWAIWIILRDLTDFSFHSGTFLTKFFFWSYTKLKIGLTSKNLIIR